MKYHEVKGDLFKVNPENWVMAHCISADVTRDKNMNRGIAKQFRKKYPEMAGKISPQLQVGKAIRYQREGHTIYNLVTKDKVWQKAKGNYKRKYYKQLKDALLDMKEQMIRKNEFFLAMPKIASGLDGGNWGEISKIIHRVFEKTKIEIQIRFIEEYLQIGNAKYLIERAKSGRSKCRMCDLKIKRDSIRLKENIPSKTYIQNKYYCKDCAIKKIFKMKKNANSLLEKLNN